MRRLALLPFIFVFLPGAAVSQLPDHPVLREGFLAWDRGDYHIALERYLEVLNGPGGEGHVPEIAALTGELYQVDELTTDGASIALGRGGIYASYEVVEGGRIVTKIYDTRIGEVAATLDGTGAAFSLGGLVTYLSVEGTPEMEAARVEAIRLQESGDRATYSQALARLRSLEAEATGLRSYGLLTGSDQGTVRLSAWVPSSMVWGDEDLFVLASPRGQPGSELLRLQSAQWRVRTVETPTGPKSAVVPVPGGRFVAYQVGAAGRGGRGGFGGGRGASGGLRGVGVTDLTTGEVHFFEGKSAPAVSADGSVLAFLGRMEGQGTVEAVTLSEGVSEPRVLVQSEMALSSPAVSPDGGWLVYQKRPVHDWEIFAVPTSGSGEELQVSNEIQHDIMPRFVDERTILAAKGEGRHRRSFLYTLGDDVTVTKLFHNNTVRTIAPEYAWEVSTDGSTVLILSERDGDTVSPERGVYLVHLDRPVTEDQLRARLENNLMNERDLRARGAETFRPIADDVRQVTEQADVSRVYQYAAELYSYGSKFITQPGNRMASEYLEAQLRSWGYEPEIQWFEARDVRTANVIARLTGTVDPEFVYTASSHYDSVVRGPGADDNSSGTTALLEAARVMKDHPQPSTIEFAFFTGEEAGLLGSREYIRRAQASGKRIVGALNNDMIGWADNHRLDNTIRYSNPGIRDI